MFKKVAPEMNILQVKMCISFESRNNRSIYVLTFTRLFSACGYETEEDKQYYGAVEFSSADTVAECQAECDRDSDCVGFGVDGNNNNRCWIHKEVSGKMYIHSRFKTSLWSPLADLSARGTIL